MSTTDYKHPEYVRMLPLWQQVRDTCAGSHAVKARREAYLPNPSEDPNSTEGRRRYQSYLHRAVYLNATGRTLQGLVGVAFSNWPRFVLPKGAEYLADDVNGSGVGLVNQAQSALADVLQTGRGGLLADCSSRDETEQLRPRTVAEAEAEGWRVTLNYYAAERILTWEVQDDRLTRLVLQETHAKYEGGEVEYIPQLRELVMEGGKQVVHIWRQFTDKGKFVKVATYKTTLPSITFHFIGATDNDPWPDTPPLLDLSDLNLAHYRNSADYEESAFLMGQPMLAITGVTDEWVKERGAVYVGSRAPLALPTGGDAKFLQVQPNTLAKEAMQDKERMMAMMGARLLAPTAAPMTATQSASETKAAYSVLSNVCDNLSEAYRAALGSVARMLNPYSPDQVDFAIDTRFNDLMLDANAIRETVAAWQAGLVPQSDAWATLRRLGVVDQGKTDDQLRAEIDAQGPALDLDAA